MSLRINIFILQFAFCNIMYAQTYKSLVDEADSLYRIKDYPHSIAVYDRALDIRKVNAQDLYNAACSASLAGQLAKANALLTFALDAGWGNFQHLRADSDLAPLYNTESWKKLLSRIETIESKYNKPVQNELIQILNEDQNVRNEYLKVVKLYGNDDNRTKTLAKLILLTDSLNLKKVKAIIDRHGWVGSDIVGEEASTSLFLVIQHSDILTQERYLPSLERAVEKKVAKPTHLALLKDRIAIRKGLMQVYGSQIGTDEKTGKYYVYPIENPRKVDERRASVGLGALVDYLKNWNIVWNPIEHENETKKK